MGNKLQSLPEGLQRNKWTMGREINVLLAQGFDVSNFLKDVPNFFKDVLRIPKFILGWGMTFNYYLRVLK